MLVPYKKSSYGGFVLDKFDLDINSYSKNFNDIEGSNISKYAIILLSSSISSSGSSLKQLKKALFLAPVQ